MSKCSNPECNDDVVNHGCGNHSCCSPECRTKLAEIMQAFYDDGHSRTEMISRFGIKGLSRFVINPKTRRRQNAPDVFTQEQQEIILGCLLSDGSICPNKVGQGGFVIAQCLEREEYILYLSSVLSSFMHKGIYRGQQRKPSRINGKINHDIQYWGGEYSKYIRLYTMNLPIFTQLDEEWYVKGDHYRRKIVPVTLKLTWRMMAHWVCGDGSNNICDRNRLMILCTDGFTVEERNFLIYRLRIDLGIIALPKHQMTRPQIYIGGEEHLKLINGIKPYIPWNCFSHKLVSREKRIASTGFVGVYAIPKRPNKFRAEPRINGKTLNLGCSFSTPEEAAAAIVDFKSKNIDIKNRGDTFK